MEKITVILSFLGLWLTSFLSNQQQLIVGFMLIFTFGILHGANDLVLISQLEQKKNSTLLKIITSYIVVVLVSVVLFSKIPVVALTLFILVSGYHFGEQHWEEKIKDGSKLLLKIFQFTYGLLILMLLFYFNKIEVIKIILQITTFEITSSKIDLVLIAVLISVSTTSYLLGRSSENFRGSIIEQLFYVGLLCIIFKVSSLIWGFTIYFIFWHSIPSLNDQIIFLYVKFTIANFKKYFKSAFLYWFISLVGIGFLYILAKDILIFDALFFSFLASITFPHAIVIFKMYEK